MNRSELIGQILVGTKIYDEAIIALLEDDLRAQIAAQETHTVLQIRSVLRFLRRWEQFKATTIATNDFLASFRDCILNVGRILSPESVVSLVSQSGARYGLFIDAVNYVNATLALPNWLTLNEKQFVETVYGKRPFISEKRRRSLGDGLLSKVTNFKYYQSYEQKVAIHTALALPAAHTMLLSLQTGGGKSLVTQMLAGSHEALTLVIVPTVALALDQERVAKEVLRDCLPVETIGCYHSGQKESVTQRMVSLIKEGKMRLLITSPEAVMKNKVINEALQQAANNKTLGSLVLDEAHIIPDWGALFRPEFQFLAIFRRKLLDLSGGSIRTYLLSATLADENVSILKDLYSDDGQWIELRSDALRSEPRYCYVRCDNFELRQKRVLELCRLMPKPLILYVLSPKDAKEWQRCLKKEGYKNVRTFTGETSDVDRMEVIKAWSEDRVDMVVATSAFGLGVDKPDVRTVIHACLPESLSRFYQEVGRGGRGGWPCLSVLCINPKGDEGIALKQIHSGDDRAASSLVPRILTAEYMVARWLSMKNSESSQHNGDVIVLDTSVSPYYFTEEQHRQRGKLNIDWNLHVLLFLLRNKYIVMLGAEYNGTLRCYYVTVKLNDLELMNNAEELLERLEIDRENELVVARDGFNHIKALVTHPEKICWGGRFVDLFPYAYESCGGCPTHLEPILGLMGFHLGKQVPYQNLASPRLPALKEYMGTYTDLLVPRRENGSLDTEEMKRLALKLNQWGLDIWVLPDICNIGTAEFAGLVLTYSEFQYTYSRHPTILSKGVFMAFGDHDFYNQSLYEKAALLQQQGIQVVYYAKESMYLQKHARTLADVMEGYTRSVDMILGE